MNKKRVKVIVALLTLNTVVITGCTSIENIQSEENSNLVNTETETIDEVFEDEDIYKKRKDIIVVNKVFALDKDYVPTNLVEINVPFSGAESSKYMEEEAAKALEEMFAAAKEDGINLIGRSGYRSYSTQEATFNSKVSQLGLEQAEKFSARAGRSEHQTGLAIDIISTEYQQLHTDFQYTETYKWLIENCADYGFILRYLKGKSDITGYNFEPWHYRYVGVEYAKEIMDSGLTLEEYTGKL